MARGNNGNQVLFGELLANTGDASVTVNEVSAQVPTTAVVEFFIDSEGPALDQALGTGALDPAEPRELETAILDRAVPAEGATIPPATSASLIILVSPAAGHDDVEFKEITVDYDVDGKRYREQILVHHVVAVDRIC